MQGDGSVAGDGGEGAVEACKEAVVVHLYGLRWSLLVCRLLSVCCTLSFRRFVCSVAACSPHVTLLLHLARRTHDYDDDDRRTLLPLFFFRRPACHVSSIPFVLVCASFGHVRSWPRIRSLNALYMLLANSAYVLQVVGLTCEGRWRLEVQRRDMAWVLGLVLGRLGLSGFLCN